MSYYITTKAIDDVLNEEQSGAGSQGTVRSSTITYDIDFPTAVITMPIHLATVRSGQAAIISGTAADWVRTSTYTNFPNHIDLFVKQSTSGIFLTDSGWVNSETPISVDTAGASVAPGLLLVRQVPADRH